MKNGKNIQPCPACSAGGDQRGSGMVQIGGKPFPCPLCGGAGALPSGSGFPVPFWYPFNGTLVATATPGPPPIPASPPLPIPLQIASESDYEWIQNLANAEFPEFVQATLRDVGSQFDFVNGPIDLSLFSGSGQLPFTTLENYLFGKKSQLQLTLSTRFPATGTQVIGVGTGAIATWTGTLPGPILAGSVSITDVVGTAADDGNGAFPANAGVVGGTINYVTGAVSITFVANTVAANLVTVTFQRGIASNRVQFCLYGFLMVDKKGVGAGQ